MGSCLQNVLTLVAVIASIPLSILAFDIALPLLSKYRSNFVRWINGETRWILVPAFGIAITIFLMRYELPKHVEIVQCGETRSSGVACLVKQLNRGKS